MSQVTRGGFAPDLVHGQFAIGSVYDVVAEDEIEALVFFTAVNLGGGVKLATFARWNEGFLDTVQIIHEADLPTTAEVEIAILELLETSSGVLGLTPGDFSTLRNWLMSMGRNELVEKINIRTKLPVALNRENLLLQESSVLGLAREDLVDSAEIMSLRDEALNGHAPVSRQRIEDAGKADMLTGVALFIERRKRSIGA
jgi:hypothetical protein